VVVDPSAQTRRPQRIGRFRSQCRLWLSHSTNKNIRWRYADCAVISTEAGANAPIHLLANPVANGLSVAFEWPGPDDKTYASLSETSARGYLVVAEIGHGGKPGYLAGEEIHES